MGAGLYVLSEHEAFCASRADFDGSENVVGVLKGEGNGKSILLNGHVIVIGLSTKPSSHEVQYYKEMKQVNSSTSTIKSFA